MKYISFYSDSNFYYCYSDKGTFFRGKNPEKYVPSPGYFVSEILTLFLGAVLNRFLIEKINTTAAIIMIALAIMISVFIGCTFYARIEKKAKIDYREIYLTDAQMNEYVSKGKRQFRIQKWILIFMLFFVTVLFCIFYTLHNLIVFFLAAMMCFLLTLAISWIKPLKKEKFFNMKLRQ